MTLYDLTNTATIQGNIEIKIFDQDGNEKESRFYRDQDDFTPFYEDCSDIEDCDIIYIYCTKSCDGAPWLVIEITRDEIPLF